jgi:predicted Zn-ribbon and HTH transcriptional regulator
VGREYTPETKQSILNAITESALPVAAADLAKLTNVAVKDLPGLVAEDLAEGRVFVWGPKSKTVYWHGDAKSAARERIRKAIAEAAEPVEAASLVKLAQVKSKDLPEMLAEDLAASRVFVWESRKLYWHRDARSAARERVVKAVAEAAQPVAVAALGELVGLTGKVAVKELPGLLSEDLAAGRVFEWQSKKLYWHRDVTTEARERLIDLARRENLSKDDLVKRAAEPAPMIDVKAVKKICAELIKEESLISALKPRDAGRALAQVVASEGVPEVAEKIYAAMHRIAFAPGTTVTFYRLRQQPELAGIAKKIFDEAALLLQQDRRALLTVHGHATALPPSEREELVTDGLGTYYASIYAR